MIGETSSIRIPNIFSEIIKLDDGPQQDGFPVPGLNRILGPYFLPTGVSFQNYKYLIIMPSYQHRTSSQNTVGYMQSDLYAPPLIYYYNGDTFTDSQIKNYSGMFDDITSFNSNLNLTISWLAYYGNMDTILGQNFNTTAAYIYRRGIILGQTVYYCSTIYNNMGANYSANYTSAPYYGLFPKDLYLAK